MLVVGSFTGSILWLITWWLLLMYTSLIDRLGARRFRALEITTA
jgi:hypothetical protein